MPTWHWARFDHLGGGDVYDLLGLRAAVFVVEQHCVYQDADGLDRHAWHLLGRDADGLLVACLRAVDPGHKHAVPSIGRVAVAAPQRGRGLGHALVTEGLRRCDTQWPGQANHISAQSHLQAFYAQHGYVPMGEAYLEDRIPHIGMHRAAP